MKQPVYVVDFDDFICQTDVLNVAPDVKLHPINQSVKDWIFKAIDNGAKIIVHTSREYRDFNAIELYLKSHNFPIEKPEVMRLITGKPHADAYYGNNYFSDLRSFRKDDNLLEHKSEYFNVLRNYAEESIYLFDNILYSECLPKLFKSIVTAWEKNKSVVILTAGNGGSYSVAEHFAQDLINQLGGRVHGHTLGGNVSQLTALANDFSYADIFSLEHKHLVENVYTNKKVILILFSVSGISPNIKQLMHNSNEEIYLITGYSNRFELLEDFKAFENINILPVPTTDYRLAENMFQILAHLIVTVLRRYHTGTLNKEL